MTVDYQYDHFHLFTSNPKETAEWYRRMFEAEVIESVQSDGKIRVDMKLCGVMVYLSDGKLAARLEKNPAGEPDPAPERAYFGLDHFGIRVKDLDQAVAELKERGAEFAVELTSIRPGARLAYVRGPDHVRIELVERDLSLDSRRS
jgi:catechol 2,3-dioxygenase-like lactoylglutathione lyase family enzyme